MKRLLVLSSLIIPTLVQAQNSPVGIPQEMNQLLEASKLTEVAAATSPSLEVVPGVLPIDYSLPKDCP